MTYLHPAIPLSVLLFLLMGLQNPRNLFAGSSASLGDILSHVSWNVCTSAGSVQANSHVSLWRVNDWCSAKPCQSLRDQKQLGEKGKCNSSLVLSPWSQTTYMNLLENICHYVYVYCAG